MGESPPPPFLVTPLFPPTPTPTEREREELKCEECGDRFGSVYSLNVHRKGHALKRALALAYRCRLCDFKTDDHEQYWAHTRTHAATAATGTATATFRCDRCKREFDSDSPILRNRPDGRKIQLCVTCNRVEEYFLNKFRAERNDKRANADPTQTHRCDKCNIAFPRLERYKLHMLTHKTDKDEVSAAGPGPDPGSDSGPGSDPGTADGIERRYNCSECVYATDEKSQFQRHELQHAKVNRVYRCDRCDCVYASVYDLKMHNLYPCREKLFECDLCDYSAAAEEILEAHRSTHRNGSEAGKTRRVEEKTFPCDLCDYYTSKEGLLRKHRRTHADDAKTVDPPNGGSAANRRLDETIDPYENVVLTVESSGKSREDLDPGERENSGTDDPEIVAADEIPTIDVEDSDDERRVDVGSVEIPANDLELKIEWDANSDGPDADGGDPVEREDVDSRAEFDENLDERRNSNADDLLEICEIEYVTDERDGCSEGSGDKISRAKKHTMSHSNPKLYECDQCQYRSYRLSNFNMHAMTHRKDKPFKCDQCDYSTIRRDRLSFHVAKHAELKKKSLATESSSERIARRITHRCSKCERTFLKRRNLVEHERTHSALRPFGCDQCDRRFTRSDYLKSHKLVHGKKTVHKCDKCDFCTDNEVYLDSHKLTHLGERLYDCDRCDKSFVNVNHLNIHKLTHEESDRFECTRCDFGTDRLEDFNSHRSTHLTENLLGCDRCDKKFVKIDHLDLHKKLRHGAEKSLECDRCDFATPAMDILTEHKLTHSFEKSDDGAQTIRNKKNKIRLIQIQKMVKVHKLANPMKIFHKCDHCDHISDTRKNLELHTLTHKSKRSSGDSRQNVNEESYDCNQCDFVTAKRDLLDRHKRGHSRGSHKCDKCDYSTETVENLNVHKLTHLSGILFRCDQCNQSFVKIEHLKMHKRKHAIESSHKCEKCDFATDTVKKLNVHKLTHLNGIVFKCDQCFQNFPNMGLLKIHKNKHEKSDQANTDKTPDRVETKVDRKNSKQPQKVVKKSAEKSSPNSKEDNLECENSSQSEMDSVKSKIIDKMQPTKVFCCHKCDFTSDKLSNLRSHLSDHENEFKCEYCSKTFQKEDFLKIHKRSEHAFKCHMCRYYTFVQAELKRHRVICMKSRPFKCNLCENAYLNMSSLLRHLNNIHPKYKHKKPLKTKEKIVSPKEITKKNDKDEQEKKIVCPKEIRIMLHRCDKLVMKYRANTLQEEMLNDYIEPKLENSDEIEVTNVSDLMLDTSEDLKESLSSIDENKETEKMDVKMSFDPIESVSETTETQNESIDVEKLRTIKEMFNTEGHTDFVENDVKYDSEEMDIEEPIETISTNIDHLIKKLDDGEENKDAEKGDVKHIPDPIEKISNEKIFENSDKKYNSSNEIDEVVSYVDY